MAGLATTRDRRVRQDPEVKADHIPTRYNVRVFPVAPVVIVIAFILWVFAGMVIGALSGWLVSFATKCGQQGIIKDALLGSFGFLVGFIGCISMPWPRNTIVEQLEGGGTVATTLNRYQHPYRVAILVAVLLPLLHEMYRMKRARTKLT
jgi:hypothetical protein